MEISTEIVIAGFGVMGTVVAFLFKALYKRSEKCEEWREKNQEEMKKIHRELGEAVGFKDGVENISALVIQEIRAAGLSNKKENKDYGRNSEPGR